MIRVAYCCFPKRSNFGLPGVQVATRSCSPDPEIRIRDQNAALLPAVALGYDCCWYRRLLALQKVMVRVAAGRSGQMREADVRERTGASLRSVQGDAQALVLLAKFQKAPRRKDFAVDYEYGVVS
jgi:hypothetical protein